MGVSFVTVVEEFVDVVSRPEALIAVACIMGFFAGFIFSTIYRFLDCLIDYFQKKMDLM